MNNKLSAILSLISVAMSIIIMLEEKYRLSAFIVFLFILNLYLISSLSYKLNNIRRTLKKNNEKLQIYEQLIDLKAEVLNLHNDVELINRRKRK